MTNMARNFKALFTNNSDHWATPKFIYDLYVGNGFIDPCPLHSEQDNLNKNYFNESLFINPPYSDISNWVKFAIRQVRDNNCYVILLIPARTDTKYFHELLRFNPHIRFIKGRLHFNNSKRSAPFPSLLIFLSKVNSSPSYDTIDYGETR